MKKILSLLIVSLFVLTATSSIGQSSQANRPSPLTKVTETLNSGATVTIEYSQPSVKGRTIGKDLEPLNGKIWRTGANEATVFKTDKEIKVNGSVLPAGKFALFSIVTDNNWTIIFNAVSDQWGAFNYKEAKDVLRVKAIATKTSDSFSEKLTFEINKNGAVNLFWGNTKVEFLLQ